MTKKPEIKFELIENNGQRITCVACGRRTGEYPFTALAHQNGTQVLYGGNPLALCELCLEEVDPNERLETEAKHHDHEAEYCEQGAKDYSTRAEKFRASAAHKRSLIGRIIKWPTREAWGIKCSERFLKCPGEFTWKGRGEDDEIPF